MLAIRPLAAALNPPAQVAAAVDRATERLQRRGVAHRFVTAEGDAADALLIVTGGSEHLALAAAETRVPQPVSAAAAGLTAKRANDDKRKPLVFVDLAAPTGQPVELLVEGPTPEWSLPIPKPAQGAPPGHAHFGFELDGLPPGVDPKGPFELTFTVVQGDRATEVKTHLD